MKQFSIFILSFIAFTANAITQTSRPIVDERLELSSIVFRLAGAEEYVCDGVPQYMKEIDEYFAPYKDHKLISYIRTTLREQQEIGYDAVASSAFYLKIENGRVGIADEAKLAEYLEREKRWNKILQTGFRMILKNAVGRIHIRM